MQELLSHGAESNTRDNEDNPALFLVTKEGGFSIHQ
jgi:hypothetical protein